MLFDLESCPAHILTIQEAEEQLLTHLRRPAEPGILKERAQETAAAASTHGGGARGGHVQWSRRPCGQFWIIRGPEEPHIKDRDDLRQKVDRQRNSIVALQSPFG